MCKRNEGESFDAYKVRRRRERETLDAHMQGVVIVPGVAENRATMRALHFKSKHFGNHGRFYTGH
jgi:hypothetical protein